MQNINLHDKKNPKQTQNPLRYIINSYKINLKFRHKPKISSFKNTHIKKQTYYYYYYYYYHLARAKNPFKLPLYSTMNLNNQ